MATPRKPISARPCHSSRSYGALPSSTARTAFGEHFSVRNLRASSRSCFCSSEKSKFMGCHSPWLCCLVQDDHVFVRRGGIEPLHQCGAALEARALIDVALVGELIAVDRGRLDQEERPRDLAAACTVHGL